MAEKVLVQPLRRKGPPIRMDARLARVLTDRGTYAYATDRRVAKAAKPAEVEVEFVPSETLDVTPQPKPKKAKRGYNRRDMKAEG